MRGLKVLDKTRRNNITPFPGKGSDKIAAISGSLQYGIQPGTTPLLAEFVQTLQNTIDNCDGPGIAPAAKAALRGYVCEPALLAAAHKQGDDANYTRHLLYAAPDGSCSVLALVWMPGQITPIHGHTAWGAVGVYEGNPFCENYEVSRSDNGAIGLQSQMKMQLKPSDLATVRPGIDDVHRIGNESQRRAITIHVYGRDLVAEPSSLNIVFGQ